MFPFLQHLPQLVKPNSGLIRHKMTKHYEGKAPQLNNWVKATQDLQQKMLLKVQDEKQMEKSLRVQKYRQSTKLLHSCSV